MPWQTAAELQLPVCLMHMQGDPRIHAGQVLSYVDVVTRSNSSSWPDRVAQCEKAGLGLSRDLLAD